MTDLFVVRRHQPLKSPRSGLWRRCLAALRRLGGLFTWRAGRTGERPEPPPIRWQF